MVLAVHRRAVDDDHRLLCPASGSFKEYAARSALAPPSAHHRVDFSADSDPALRPLWDLRAGLAAGLSAVLLAVLALPAGAAAAVATTSRAAARCRTAKLVARPIVSPIALASACRYARSRFGSVSFAVVEDRTTVRGYRRTRGYPSASVVKAMVMVAVLRRAGQRRLTRAERGLLYPMITRSDNAAAVTLWNELGPDRLRRVAAAAGMRRFAIGAHLFEARIDASDQARFFLVIDRLVPAAHRAYARRLLASIVSWQRWGIAPAAERHNFRARFKGGWRTGITHQVALLQRDGRRLAIAVLTADQPSMDYGEATIEEIADRLLRHACTTARSAHPMSATPAARALVDGDAPRPLAASANGQRRRRLGRQATLRAHLSAPAARWSAVDDGGAPATREDSSSARPPASRPPIPGRSARRSPSAPVAHPWAGPPPRTPHPGPPPTRHRPWGWIIVCVLLLLVAGRRAIWAVSRQSDLDEQKDATTQAQQDAEQAQQEANEANARSASCPPGGRDHAGGQRRERPARASGPGRAGRAEADARRAPGPNLTSLKDDLAHAAEDAGEAQTTPTPEGEQATATPEGDRDPGGRAGDRHAVTRGPHDE
jgi:hypothetical protein